ncbi:hypothetical protein GCM10010211_78840 [Streptomyces albospinus]|uniref:Uncharacterized protein n=1 Tax=Streptomyces albospinus TaxID=285515 RepID=A0ABQ2VMZ7_9ACTN|nr:hypothetical protein [Streptomyces albospinus]GGU99724.1 hypothetical protein GCM10010211_78840 [Streptomyces albospinus]
MECTLPRSKAAGEESEVDFADTWLALAGQRRMCVLTLRCPAQARLCTGPTASQEAFLKPQVEASKGWTA